MSFTWLNEPKKWSDSSSVITVHTDGKTDFWRKTRNGAERDNGHFYYQIFSGDQSFTATVNVRGEYNARYDQAGLMLRIDEKNWIKCGVEYVNGEQFASVVVTVNGWSDWSIVSINSPDILKLRIKREKEAVHIEYAESEIGEYKMMRLAYFPVIDKSQSLMVGIMCASPNSDTQGFNVKFEQLNIIQHHENKD
jgi:regulation of enolase protein 1 (concanavalin A-like superfamily)